MKKVVFSAFLSLLIFVFSSLVSEKVQAACNEGGCCQVNRVGLPGGRGVRNEIENKCSTGYKPSPTYGTTNRCECVLETVELCTIQGETCTSDTECQSSPGCGNFVCLGFIARRTPGKCEDRTNICSKANTSCATDSECESGGPGCSNYTCWEIGQNRSSCRFGEQPAEPIETAPSGSKPLYCDPKTGQKTNDPAGGLSTAFGCIDISDRNAFVAWFLKWAMGIAGGVAFLLMLYAGFQIMTASGNPERLQHGRELLTAAISGLILIIFSVFLLKLIGVEILDLPEFGASTTTSPSTPGARGESGFGESGESGGGVSGGGGRSW